MLSGQNGCASICDAGSTAAPCLWAAWSQEHGKVCAQLLPQLWAAGQWFRQLFSATIPGSRCMEGFIRAVRQTGTAAAIRWMAYQSPERRWEQGGWGNYNNFQWYLFSVWLPGSTSVTESWECWIICMEQMMCSDKAKPMRDTGSSSASHRSPKASLIYPRKQGEPSRLQPLQSPGIRRGRDNDLH